MDYNTQREKLIMPEYGRIVQEMVNYALTLKDREERQHCANTIIAVMGNLYAQQRDIPDFVHKLWDHLAIMSNYQLDIDYPCEISSPQDGEKEKPRVEYPMQKIRYRHYGHLVETLLGKLRDMPEGEERDQLTKQVIVQMKRSLSVWNKDVLSSEKIVSDIALYTDGQVQLDPAEIRCDANFAPNAMPPRMAKGKRNRKY